MTAARMIGRRLLPGTTNAVATALLVMTGGHVAAGDISMVLPMLTVGTIWTVSRARLAAIVADETGFGHG